MSKEKGTASEEGLTLYLHERESEEYNGPSGTCRILDVTITSYPLTDQMKQKFWGCISIKELGYVTLSKAEIEEIAGLDEDVVKRRLFSKFSITNLSPRPGQPKGPCYWIDDEVYEVILRPDLKVIK